TSLSGPTTMYGLTIVFPPRGSTGYVAYTDAKLDFLADTTWEDFIQLHLARGPRPPAGAAGQQDGMETAPSSALAGHFGLLASPLPVNEPDFAETLTLGARTGLLGNDSIEAPFQLGTVNGADFAIH